MKKWIWGVWILLIIVSFGIMEGIAIYTHTVTLSQSVWSWSAAFPLVGPIVCFVFGGLTVHFWWREGG